ncbi:MAG TPA: rhomboid family intramembrane serine protease, partial [Fimbriimonas sp.]|nr:rhomboid family intramembrane serine protease [Fimbriimonas sp.]
GQFVFGFSGINAAMVGFGLVARRYHPNLQATFCNRTIQAYCAWFAIGFCTTLLYITNISSVAHFTGAIFGVVCGFAFVKLSVPAKIGLSLLTLASAIPLVWCPLSYEWNISKGYHLIQHREYSESLPYILQAQRLAPDVAADTYVLECLVSCHAHLRQKDEYNRTIDLFRIKDKARAQVYEKKYGYPFGVFN